MAKDKRDGETEQQEQLEALDPRFHQLVDGSASIGAREANWLAVPIFLGSYGTALRDAVWSPSQTV